jgi:hypothetical protein
MLGFVEHFVRPQKADGSGLSSSPLTTILMASTVDAPPYPIHVRASPHVKTVMAKTDISALCGALWGS